MNGFKRKSETSDSLEFLDMKDLSSGKRNLLSNRCCRSMRMSLEDDSELDSDPESGDAMLEPPESRPAPQQTSSGRRPCMTEHRRRLSCGLFLTSLVGLAWVGGTHLLRAMHVDYASALAANALVANGSWEGRPYPLYEAPFFTTWVCASLNCLFYPVYLTAKFCAPAPEQDSPSLKKEISESLQPYQERGLSVGRFVCRCLLFTTLWSLTNYLFVRSLSLLDATDVIALYTTHCAFVYLLSWVLLQEQFVGIRIVAVILCNTGIALFAYMDGDSRARTLGGVVLAASAAAGTAVYKVLFKKLVGEVSLGQLSFFFSLVGLCNVLLVWPLMLGLYLGRAETLRWDEVPWLPLLGAAMFLFMANLLGNFGVLWTYEVFLTLGFVCAVPASAVVDVYLYQVLFRGMKLAGIVLTLVGFCLVLLPENWPDYLTLLLRWRRRSKNTPQPQQTCTEPRTSYTSRLRTHSGRVK
ncbi:putative thiamine transporter SLC35F3 [Uloborus diversus]|uniref:putative thiamine transporter SLC35F3 n=1 Tax=Uloborus diversus TaxID=327109 RepID=UPI00240A3636|nr:putative thiamine transporter SLC35F3 [Uloborus diversus]